MNLKDHVDARVAMLGFLVCNSAKSQYEIIVCNIDSHPSRPRGS